MKKKYLHLLEKEEYDTIFKLVLGTFNIKCKDRTRKQKNAALKYWRHKDSFSVEDGELLFEGKKVLQRDVLKSVVKHAFNVASGCGARPLYVNLKKDYSAVSERNILKEYNKSKKYQKFFPTFDNKPLMKPITADRVNERWQIDLIDMKNDKIKEKDETYRYILSILNVFSRFLILIPLKRKTSGQIANELQRIFQSTENRQFYRVIKVPSLKGGLKMCCRRTKLS